MSIAIEKMCRHRKQKNAIAIPTRPWMWVTVSLWKIRTFAPCVTTTIARVKTMSANLSQDGKVTGCGYGGRNN